MFILNKKLLFWFFLIIVSFLVFYGFFDIYNTKIALKYWFINFDFIDIFYFYYCMFWLFLSIISFYNWVFLLTRVNWYDFDEDKEYIKMVIYEYEQEKQSKK